MSVHEKEWEMLHLNHQPHGPVQQADILESALNHGIALGLLLVNQ